MLSRSALVAATVLFFGAALAPAQPPTDALRAKAYAPLPAARKFLAENPGLVEE